jgi:hypothetical protein
MARSLASNTIVDVNEMLAFVRSRHPMLALNHALGWSVPDLPGRGLS